jgi:hypothetical protein
LKLLEDVTEVLKHLGMNIIQIENILMYTCALVNGNKEIKKKHVSKMGCGAIRLSCSFHCSAKICD